MWGGHSFGYWFWNVALDGLVGAFLGAAIAAVFAVRVLRMQFGREDQLRLETALGDAIRKASYDCSLLLRAAFGGEEDPAAGFDLLIDLDRSLYRVTALSRLTDPVFSKALEIWSRHLNDHSFGAWPVTKEDGRRQVLINIASNIEIVLSRREVDSTIYRKLDEAAATEFLEALRAGDPQKFQQPPADGQGSN